MKWARTAATAALAALLSTLGAACGAPPQDAAKSAPADAAATGQEETVFDDLVGTQDKARAVEAAAAERQRELQQTLEDAEGK